MFISISTTAKRDPRKYRWLEYMGRKVTLHVQGSDRHVYEVELSRGEKFGIKTLRGFTYMLDASDLSIQFKLENDEAKRIIDNSRGYEGKISRYKVLPAEGGKDAAAVRERRKASHGRIWLTADSSVFTNLLFDPKKELLYIQFRNGAVWEYSDVTKKEAKGLERAASQGRWFNRRIKGLKEGTRLDRLPE